MGEIIITDRPSFTNQQINTIVPNGKVNYSFLYYSIRPRKQELLSLGATTGVRTPILNKSAFCNLKVTLPPLPTQRRVASILGAYDDLIEVNRQRIAVLEEMARRLFDEWFVHFRFPGHEDHGMIETEHGRLPEGWTVQRLDAIAEINARTLRPGAAPERIKYIDIASVSLGHVEQFLDLPFIDAPGRARRLVRDGSIIWSTVRPNRRSFAVLLRPPSDLVVSTGFAVLDAVKLPFSYLYMAVTTDLFVGYLTGRATGSAYPAVTGATFGNATIIVPPKALGEQFGEFTEPKLRLIEGLRTANTKLAASRDLLLPRLISGELSVAEAERELDAAA
jgi:type I restriction enzyme S subunit